MQTKTATGEKKHKKHRPTLRHTHSHMQKTHKNKIEIIAYKEKICKEKEIPDKTLQNKKLSKNSTEILPYCPFTEPGACP